MKVLSIIFNGSNHVAIIQKLQKLMFVFNKFGYVFCVFKDVIHKTFICGFIFGICELGAIKKIKESSEMQVLLIRIIK